MFDFFAGRRFCKDMSKEIGCDKSLLSTALLETGITWYHLKIYKNSGYTAKQACIELIPNIIQGLDILENNFGHQQEIVEARDGLSKLE